MNGYLGDFPTSSIVYCLFNTFSSAGASITISGFTVGDILVYKNGSTVQRSSTSGFTLLDTDGIDFDGQTGIHGFKIDTSDNADSGFYSAGGEYDIVVGPITCDGQTVSFHAGRFSLERTGGMLALLKDATNGLSAIKTAAAFASPNFAGTVFLKQSTAVTVKIGPFLLAGGAIASALTIQKADVRLSKNGGAYAATNSDQGASDAGAAHTELGHYNIAFNTTDTNTLGRLRASISETGASPVSMEFMILAPRAFDALMDALGSFSAMIAGAAVTGTLTTAAMTTDLSGYGDDRLIGATVIFQGGTLDKERARISDYASASGLITFSAALSGSPVNGQAFLIV